MKGQILCMISTSWADSHKSYWAHSSSRKSIMRSESVHFLDSCSVPLYHISACFFICTYLTKSSVLLGQSSAIWRKDIQLNNKTKQSKWDPALCGKVTICSVEAVFFCVTTFGEWTLEDSGTDTPSTSFRQELLACGSASVWTRCLHTLWKKNAMVTQKLLLGMWNSRDYF